MNTLQGVYFYVETNINGLFSPVFLWCSIRFWGMR